MNKRILFFSFVILTAVILLGISLGSTRISLEGLFTKSNNIILQLRLMRIVLAFIAGAGLAVAGVIFQAILRNPLAEPYVLGVSSGAGLGAVMALFFNLSAAFLPPAAFVGSCLTMIIVYRLSKIHGHISSQSLLLSGVITGAVFSSLLLFFVSISPNEAMHGITWWLLGSLEATDLKLIGVVSFLISMGIVIAFYFSQDLNAISIGEEEAHHLGIKVAAVKRILFIVASVITASIVCVCGIIGFIGLIIPHAIRVICGPDHKTVLPVSAITAGSFLIFADTLSRTLLAPVEIPIGVITALIGGPVFIFLLRHQEKAPF